MKTMTALALVLASASAAYAAGPHGNESFIEQVGAYNEAQISQKNGNNDQATFQAGAKNSVLTDQVSKLRRGQNSSGNVQVGQGNTASTSQVNKADADNARFTNNSFTAQFGTKNDSIVEQTGGKNDQGTLQIGDKNFAGVSQINSSSTRPSARPVGADNAAFAAQIGSSNRSATFQTSKDKVKDGDLMAGHSNDSMSLQIGVANETRTRQESIGGKANGPANSAAAIQIGRENFETTLQGGHVEDGGGKPKAERANYTNASFVSQVGVLNVASVNQNNGANTQALLQTGYGNSATIDQATRPAGSARNNALTSQRGVNNQVNVGQSVAVPLAVGANNSLISQVGGSNVINAAQSVGAQASAGNNNQLAVQVGYGNEIQLSQATGANVSNTSFTAQYGIRNVAVVSQK